MRATVAAVLAIPALIACRDTTRLIPADGSLRFEPNNLDFGVVSVHDHPVKTLTITNLGRGPVTLSQFAIDPGDDALTTADGQVDFTADTGQFPAILATGESITIDVHYDPTAQGPALGQLDMATDDRESPEVTVPVEGVALDAHAQIQEVNLDFGAIEVGTQLTQPLHLANPFPMPVTVTPSDAGLDGLDQFSFQPVEVPPQSTGDLLITFSPTAVDKVATALSVTACDGCAAQLVNLFGQGLDSDLVVTPGPIDFGDVSGAVATQNVRIENVSTLPVDLHGVALDPSSDPQYSVILPVPGEVLVPGAWLATTIQYQVTRPGDAQGTFEVLSSSHRHPSLNVPITGSASQ